MTDNQISTKQILEATKACDKDPANTPACYMLSKKWEKCLNKCNIIYKLDLDSGLDSTRICFQNSKYNFKAEADCIRAHANLIEDAEKEFSMCKNKCELNYINSCYEIAKPVVNK